MGDLTVGSVVAGLRIDGIAGQGGMGVVYRAFDPSLQRTVALKVIADEFAADPDFHERFRQEARAAAGIDHPNVVTVHWAGEESGRLFLVMQYVAGTDLRALISERGRVDPVLAVDLVSQVAAALDAAHDRGLVHRDVKPANILVAGPDRVPRAYLTDFGLTRPVDASRQITGTGFLVGTEAYMAPELFGGSSATVASDVYALGCVLFHALSGRVFPRGGGRTSLRGEVADPDLALALDAVVRRALAVNPGERYDTAGALATAAKAALAEATHGDTRAPRSDGPARPPSAETTPHPSLPPTPAGPVYLPVSGTTTEFGPVSTPPATLPLGGGTVPVGPTYGPPVPQPQLGWGAYQSSGPHSLPQAQQPPVPQQVSWPGPSSWPTSAAPAPRRSRAPIVLAAAAVVAVVVVAVLAIRLLGDTTSQQPAADAPASADSVVLAEVEDDEGSVRLTWTGPAGLDYAVDIAEEGRPATTKLAGRTYTFVSAVDPDRQYCFQIRATDGEKILSSNAQGLRGATCHTA